MGHTGTILIKQARIYDPAQQCQGEVRDLYLADGKVSKPFDDPQQIIHAAGRPVLAGGIDPYGQLAAPGQALIRTMADLPSPGETGRIYARMGYVHVHHPFTTLLTSRLVRHSLQQIPFVDTSTSVSIDLRDMGQCIKAGNPEEFCRLARTLIKLSGATGLFLAFPYLKHKKRQNIIKNLSPKKVFSFLSQLEDSELFPISLWGMPGLLENDIPTPERFHIAGLGLAMDSEGSLEKARRFLEAGGSADLGLTAGGRQLVIDGSSTMSPSTLSLDIGLHHPLRFSLQDMPFDGPVGKMGWSLLNETRKSWHLALAASGPAGGQIGGMPEIAAWLMDPGARPQSVRNIFNNDDFNLYELARMTRFEPARFLGLPDSGHLQEGAKASLAIYDVNPETVTDRITEALSHCWCLVKEGVLVRENGEFTGQVPPNRIYGREMDVDESALTHTNLLQYPTLRFEHLNACQ